MRHLVVVLVLVVPLARGMVKVKKMFDTTDPGLYSMFYPLPSSTIPVTSLIECSTRLESLLNQPNAASRPGGFVFYRANMTCTFGTTPPYVTFTSVPLGSSETGGAYFLSGLPSTAQNADTFFYALFNDQQAEYVCHPDFINAWPAGSPPVFTNATYTTRSPVLSMGGTYALTFNGGTLLKFVTPKPTQFLGLTILIWFYAAADATVGDCLVSLCTGNSSNPDVFDFFASGDLRLYIREPATNHFSPSNIRTLGVWNYVGVTFNAVTTQYAFWVNGTTTGFSSTASVPVPNVSLILVGGTCYESYRTTGPAMASLEIYQRELSQKEIQAAMAKSYTGRTWNGIMPPY